MKVKELLASGLINGAGLAKHLNISRQYFNQVKHDPPDELVNKIQSIFKKYLTNVK